METLYWFPILYYSNYPQNYVVIGYSLQQQEYNEEEARKTETIKEHEMEQDEEGNNMEDHEEMGQNNLQRSEDDY